MKFLVFLSLVSALCISQIHAASAEETEEDRDLERDPKSFYGIRRIPFGRRSLIPSRFYPNLFYSPVWIPRVGGLRRVYRSEPEMEDMPPMDELEKRSIEKKMAMMPKWKADIIRNLFGKGNRFGPSASLTKGAASIHEELIEVPFGDAKIFDHERSLDVDEILEEIEQEEREELVSEVDEVNDESVEVDDVSQIEIELVEEERRRRGSEDDEMEESESVNLGRSNKSRRRRSSDMEEEEEVEETQPEKRSARSFLISEGEEDVDPEESVYMDNERLRRNILGEEEEMEEDVDFSLRSDEEETNGEEESSTHKRSTYFSGGGGGSSFSRRSSVQRDNTFSSSLRSSQPTRSKSYSSLPRSTSSRLRGSGDSDSRSSTDSYTAAAPVSDFSSRSLSSDNRAFSRDGYSGRLRRNVMGEESEKDSSDEELISMMDESEEEEPSLRRYL